MRLIDADKLMKKCNCQKDCNNCDFFTDGDSWCRGNIFGITVMQMPTVDAVPVVRGHWIKREGFITEYECSVCQHSDSKLTAIRGHYCWYCGAKMDETIS